MVSRSTVMDPRDRVSLFAYSDVATADGVGFGPGGLHSGPVTWKAELLQPKWSFTEATYLMRRAQELLILLPSLLHVTATLVPYLQKQLRRVGPTCSSYLLPL